MIQYQLKLRPCKSQEREMERYLYHLTSVYNWAIRKIELNAANNIYFGRLDFLNILAWHSERVEIPSKVLSGVLRDAYDAWRRCFKNVGGKPRLKGDRNRMNSFPICDLILLHRTRAAIPGVGRVRFHKMDIPAGKIKSGRVCKRASGWYLCLFIESDPQAIPRLAEGRIGIDPGFSNLLTTSDGELIEHPRELEAGARRLAQAQRGHGKQLTARLQERLRNRRKDRNHKLSRRLVAENILIAFSKDNHQGIAKRFGKSVASSSHYQLRQMLSYKSAYSGTKYVEVDSRNSTRACSECGCLSGPTGLAGLSVRQWRCPCGAEHDRDVNAARNTLIAAAGIAVEVARV